MIGVALAIFIALASSAQLITFYLTSRPYRRHSIAMDALVRHAHRAAV